MATIRKTKKHGNVRWEVDLGFDDTGKRLRHYHETEAEANAEVKDHDKAAADAGTWWAKLGTEERQRIIATLRDIQEEFPSLKLSTLFSEWKEMKKISPLKVKPMACDKVVAEWRRRKLEAGVDAEYVEIQCRTLFKQFFEGREKVPFHEILVEDLETWDKKYKTKGSKRTRRAVFSSLWAVAVVKGWCEKNIVKELNPVGRITHTVSIWPNEFVIKLLAAILSDEVLHPFLATVIAGLFGCMRPDETTSDKAIRNKRKPLFGWDNINLKTARLTVPDWIAKTGDTRVARLQPVAIEWFTLCKEMKCEFIYPNQRRLREFVMGLIGLKVWTRDSLRKLCATHLRTVYRNDHDVVLDMGHSVAVLLKHYAALQVPPEVSDDYWKITPARVKEYMKTKEWEQFLRDEALKPGYSLRR